MDTLAQLLDDSTYQLVSFCEKSIPTPGSPCRPKTNLRRDLPVEKVIRHKNGNVTLKIAGIAYLKFWKGPTA